MERFVHVGRIPGHTGICRDGSVNTLHIMQQERGLGGPLFLLVAVPVFVPAATADCLPFGIGGFFCQASVKLGGYQRSGYGKLAIAIMLMPVGHIPAGFCPKLFRVYHIPLITIQPYHHTGLGIVTSQESQFPIRVVGVMLCGVPC